MEDDNDYSTTPNPTISGEFPSPFVNKKGNEEFENVFADPEVEDVDTGIITKASSTHFPIMEGFEVHGDHFIFLTLDVTRNNVMIEVFHFENKKFKSKGIMKLCGRESYDSWSVALDP